MAHQPDSLAPCLFDKRYASYLEALPLLYRNLSFDLRERGTLEYLTIQMPAHHLAWIDTIIVQRTFIVTPEDESSLRTWEALWKSYAVHLYMVKKFHVHIEPPREVLNTFSHLTGRDGYGPTSASRTSTVAKSASSWLDAPISMPMPTTLILHENLSVPSRRTGNHSETLRVELAGVRPRARTQLVEQHGETAVREDAMVGRAKELVEADLKAQWQEV